MAREPNSLRWILATTATALSAWPMSAAAAPPARAKLLTDQIAQPIFLTHAPGDDAHLVVCERPGVVRVFSKQLGEPFPMPLLDISHRVSVVQDNGLLGLAFDPDFADNGYLFVSYIATDGHGVIERYTATVGDLVADPDSAHVVLRVPRPTGHNGGWIGFSPLNGYLYITSGDGDLGGTLDVAQRAQNTVGQLLGKVLRIDPRGDAFPDDPNRNYLIPPGNPFIGAPGDDEIWAYGVRNPWRASFDRVTGDFYFGDVGMDTWEEVNFERATSTGGRNYGWPCMEGLHCTGSTQCVCDHASLTGPFFEYGHTTGVSVTGGYVYRGAEIPEFQGLYFFADFLGAKLWSCRLGEDGVMTDLRDRSLEIVTSDSPAAIRFVASMGEGADGELYLCTLATSRIYKIVPNTCLAEIDRHPVSQSRQVGAAISLSVYGASSETINYRWRKDGEDLFDGPGVSGAATRTLTLSELALDDNGSYDAVLTTSCGSVTSDAASVGVFICRSADFNLDGSVTLQDLFDFLAAYFATDPRADFNQVGGIGVQDILDFLTSWFIRCV